jgi:hypothetical protein
MKDRSDLNQVFGTAFHLKNCSKVLRKDCIRAKKRVILMRFKKRHKENIE